MSSDSECLYILSSKPSADEATEEWDDAINSKFILFLNDKNVSSLVKNVVTT